MTLPSGDLTLHDCQLGNFYLTLVALTVTMAVTLRWRFPQGVFKTLTQLMLGEPRPCTIRWRTNRLGVTPKTVCLLRQRLISGLNLCGYTLLSQVLASAGLSGLYPARGSSPSPKPFDVGVYVRSFSCQESRISDASAILLGVNRGGPPVRRLARVNVPLSTRRGCVSVISLGSLCTSRSLPPILIRTLY